MSNSVASNPHGNDVEVDSGSVSDELKSSCPYAQVMSTEHHVNDEVRRALHLAKTSCPAFQNGNQMDSSQSVSCPFRRASSTEEFQKLLQSVPPSHYSGQTEQKDLSVPFRLALEHVHAVSQAIHSNDVVPSQHIVGTAAFTLRGGCPFKHIYLSRQVDAENAVMIPFVDAMESLSLSAIMSEMLGEEEFNDERTIHEHGLESLSAVMHRNVKEIEQATVQPDDLNTVPSSKLSTALKQGTSASHRAAENVHFVRNFIKGIIPRKLFIQLLHNLCHVYSALEEELDRNATLSIWQPLHRPQQLSRTQSLSQDLFWFTGSFHPNKPSPATADYITRLHFVAQSSPLLLLSHAYTRYLGDLSGGRVLARVARRALELPADGSGLKFYEFESIPEGAKEFKNWYRLTLDSLSLTEEEVRKLVAEANIAFALNMRMFEELDVIAGIEGAEVRPLSEALKYGDDEVNETKAKVVADVETKADKCPFATMSSQTKVLDIGMESKQPDVVRGKCPWPFILFHDPVEGMKDYKSSIVLCLLSFYVYFILRGMLK